MAPSILDLIIAVGFIFPGSLIVLYLAARVMCVAYFNSKKQFLKEIQHGLQVQEKV